MFATKYGYGTVSVHKVLLSTRFQRVFGTPCRQVSLLLLSAVLLVFQCQAATALAVPSSATFLPPPHPAQQSLGWVAARSYAAQVDAARAVYWQSVANYRQTVLTAFQQVEDQLAAIRILKQQLGKQQAAVKAERDAVRVFMNQYRAGTIDFTTVVTAQLTLLSDEEAELTIRQDLFLASVSLIEALGGGWDTNLLPAQKDLVKELSLLPQY